MLHSIKGFENAVVMRHAYAIEYDCIDALQLKSTLEFKKIKGLLRVDSLTEVQVMKRLQHRE